jgi:lysophospholipid acyltransferase (LPLAT)-like uncharacterized protein
MRAAQGAVQAARLAGVPILPIAYTARPSLKARSWDSMMIPSLFARGIIRWGAPIEIARDTNIGTATRDLEARLNDLVHALDEELGLPPVEPAPQPVPAQMAKGHC